MLWHSNRLNRLQSRDPRRNSENTAAAKDAEPTKGVQTYIAVSMYRRLSDIKLTRGETIGNLVAEAVALWLDVQEGKQKVSEVI